MKKFLFSFMLVMIGLFSCAMSVDAQTYKYRTQQLAIASVNQYTGKYTWSNWQKCVLDIYIDLDNEKIYIDSNTPQYYSVLSCGSWTNDNGGGKQLNMRVVDQDGDVGGCRLRIEANGNSQVYIDWADCAYVYSGLVRLR